MDNLTPYYSDSEQNNHLVQELDKHIWMLAGTIYSYVVYWDNHQNMQQVEGPQILENEERQKSCEACIPNSPSHGHSLWIYANNKF